MPAYAIALWLGCYLLARRPVTVPLLSTGLGLLAYAAALAAEMLATGEGDIKVTALGAQPAEWLARLQTPLLFVPAVCWCVALAAFASPNGIPRWRAVRLSAMVIVVAAVAVAAGGVLLAWLSGALVAGLPASPPWLDVLYIAASGVVLLALLALAVRASRFIPVPRARALTLVSALFFGLGGGLLLLRLPWLPQPVLVLAIGADLLVFGWCVVALDAFDAVERLRADFTRSLAGAGFLVAIFGGQVALALVLGAGAPTALTALLLGVIAAAIVVPTFWDHLQRLLDYVVFGPRSSLGDRRAALLASAGALPRRATDTDVLALPEEEFIAITRRALSYFGDLPKLAGSPLIRLPIVDQRLQRRDAGGDLLERAAALKVALAESIARLKPPDGARFGTTDEWRHYNALYFPYVAGLRPYSRRPLATARPSVARSAGVENEQATAASEAALRWFRAQVPERTLHNWQRAAARLVALDLRERASAASTPPALHLSASPLAPPEAPDLPRPLGPSERECAPSSELAAHGSTFPSRGSG